MALTFTELEAITRDYFLLDDGKATDIYFKTSYFVEQFMKGQVGLWERPNGGKTIKVPLEYNPSEGGWYARSDVLSSDDREQVNAAFFRWKHNYGNATVYRTDELENSGEYAEVQLVTQRIENAQKTARDNIAKGVYLAGADGATGLTGLLSMCSTSLTTSYGGIVPNDLVAADGSKPWVGNVTTTGEVVSLDVIRTLASSAKIYDGPDGKPNYGFTTETLYNKIMSLLQAQQRYVKEGDAVKAGFLAMEFEGKKIAADDYCPSGDLFLINSNACGFGIHSKGYFARTEWRDLDGPAGKTMKIFWDGNLICSNRKAHALHTSLTTS